MLRFGNYVSASSQHIAERDIPLSLAVVVAAGDIAGAEDTIPKSV